MQPIMASQPAAGNYRAKLTEMGHHLLCVFVDSLFLVFWTVPNVYLGVYLGYLIDKFHLNGIDGAVFFCLRILFAFATLAPVSIFIYKDIRIMVIRANQDIEIAALVRSDLPTNSVVVAVVAKREVE
jgi:hypothetical protein